MSRFRVALTAVSLLLGACTHATSGLEIPLAIRNDARFVVLPQANDERALDETIAEILRENDLDAEASPVPAPDYVVTYTDRWYWNLRTYLIDLRIDVREYGSNVLIATGRSFQDSPATAGRSERDIIADAVEILLSGEGADAPSRQDSAATP